MRLALVAAATPAVAQQPAAKRAALAKAEEKAVADCLALVRRCALPDGSFNMVDHGKAAGSPRWTAPYFVNHAVIALVAGHEAKANPADLALAGKWLDWCAVHQEKGGYWCDRTGTVGGPRNEGKVDAHDSSAALFLTLTERYRRAGGKPGKPVVAAAKAALTCIEGVTDADGLTWAKPDYKVKFLMDNIEVYAGLKSAEGLFAATGSAAEAKAARGAAAAVAKGLAAYWQGKEPERFAWALHPNGDYDGGMDKLYPHGLAQLYGTAFVAAESAPFAEATRKFKPQTTPEAIGAERFLIAAERLGPKEADPWRAKVVKDVATYNPKAIYCFRPGLAALALLEGADWMPSLSGGK